MEITINNKTCTCEKGELLLDVARRNRIFIPTMCDHPEFSGRGACRVCIVEVVENGRSKVVTSCLYPIERECIVYADSERIKRDRAMVFALLREQAPASTEIMQMSNIYKAPKSERFVRNEGNKCILCGLCVRACDSLGVGALSLVERGTIKKVSTPFEMPSLDCIGCGSCATICPTNFIIMTQDEQMDIRSIWGRDFNLVRCESCNAIINTAEQIAHSYTRGEVPTDKAPADEVAASEAFVSRVPASNVSISDALSEDHMNTAMLCDACKRKAVASNMVKAHRL